MVHLVTSLKCILPALFLCNSVIVTSLKSKDFSASNAKWFESIYQRIINSTFNNNKKRFSLVKLLMTIPPRNSNWKVKDDPGSTVPNKYYEITTSTPTNMSLQLPINSSEALQEWSRIVASYRIKIWTANKDYQTAMEDKYGQCTGDNDCQRKVLNSRCIYQNGRRVCSCYVNYVKYNNECLAKVANGKLCYRSVQCVEKPNECLYGYCNCPDGYKLQKESCIYVADPQSNKSETLIWPLMIGVVIVVMAIIMFVILMYFISRRMKATRTQESMSSEQRGSTISETCNERVEKPPPYDEAIAMPTTVLTSAIQGPNQMSPPNDIATLQQTTSTE